MRICSAVFVLSCVFRLSAAMFGRRLLSHVPSIPQEYCQLEKFIASCDRNHVILMLSALYGRMRIGRCVSDNLGHLGCSKDVLSLSDRRCSGRQSCSIVIPDAEMGQSSPCYKELKVYFEASYTCVRVTPTAPNECSKSTNVQVTSYPGYITNAIDPSCTAQEHHSWTLHVRSGQKLNLTLINFNAYRTANQNDDSANKQACAIYGFIEDKIMRNNVTICGGAYREKQVYLSASEHVKVVLLRAMNTSRQTFLLKHQAVGCADLSVTPSGAWVKRNGDETIVGCYASRYTWHLNCHGNRWSGVIGNCSQYRPDTAGSEGWLHHTLSLSQSSAIGIVAAVALVICSLILLAGFSILRRYKRQYALKAVKTPTESTYTATSTLKTSETDTKSDNKPYTITNAPNNYTHIWEFPLPDPATRRGSQAGVYKGRTETRLSGESTA